MLYRDSHQQVYRAEPLERFEWLEHWFGTRHSDSYPNEPNLATVHQIHSDICVLVEQGSGRVGEGDALLTNTPGQLVAVRTADCLPILIADQRLHAVAAVHAGWRGTVLGVVAKAVAEMGKRFSSRPEDLHVAIGPGIGVCCYEIGPEVAAEFHLSGRTKVDLAETNRKLLVAAGVPNNHIYLGAPCTFCVPQEFYSYRREKNQAGRMLSGIGVRE